MQKYLVLFFLISPLAVNADVLTPVQRFFGMGGEYPAYSDEEQEIESSAIDQAPYSPADSDFGVQEILVRHPEVAPVIFDSRTTVFHTDNAPSGNVNTDDPAWASSSRMSLSWRPHLIAGWFGDIGLGTDILRFDDSSATDYENLNTRLGMYHILPDLDDTIVFVRYEFQRLTTGSLGDGDYNAQRVRAGLQKVLWEAPRHQFAASASGAYEWTARPDVLERNELAIDVTYKYSITDTLYTVASLRSAYFDFDQLNREDLFYGMGLELIWQFNQNFRANASVFYDRNDSNSVFGLNDYESWTGGIGFGMQWVF
ncbi:MAG: outer membrane beta-barrel protein [Armatimonadetes bacterium]|nr:outer membrane beta-barrel protein [Akkermansiaceae bacterium]